MAKKAAKKAASEPPADGRTDEQQASESIVCPIPTDPAAGDKTPAVVAWWRDNHPEEYERRYARRVVPTELLPPPQERGPVSDFDDEDDKPRKPKVIM